MDVEHEYRPVYQTSLVDPADFWSAAAQGIEWDVPPQQIVDAADKRSARWFPDGRLNTCVNALDRHVRAGTVAEGGRADQAALIYVSAMTDTTTVYTYAELLEEVARFAGAMRDLGVVAGDRVVIYLPMIPEAVIAMLACARIGAVHSVVFGGFAAPELAARIDDAEPVLIVTASGGIEPNRRIEYPPIVLQALDLAQTASVRTVIVKQRAGFPTIEFPAAQPATDVLPSSEQTVAARWVDWNATVADVTPAEPVPVAATDPLYILYTSGTTGKPKGVVRDNGGHAVALSWSMRNIYDVGPGQVFWAASDVGWVVGHSYIVYAPLLVGATTVLYEGKPVGTPDAGVFWKIIDEHDVRVLFTAPTALRAIRRADPEAAAAHRHDLSRLRALFCAGERLDPATFEWATGTLLAGHPDTPVVDHWWQTETGWPICADPLGLQELPVKPGSSCVPVPGYRLRVLDANGNPVPTGVEGNIVIGLPLPPGALTGLWRDRDRFIRSYLSAFPGHYLTGDSGYFDEDGYLYVLGRSDDVINMAGHRLSAGSIEAAIAGHDAIAECAVIGVPDELKGALPLAYVVLKQGVEVDPEQLRAELAERVREQIGAIATLHSAIIVSGLPKTRSGKILRKTIRQLTAGEQVETPATIEDPAVLTALADRILANPPLGNPADGPSTPDRDGDPVAPTT
ncbi:AMP-binding protein [Nocardia asteroides]|uniref:Propionate--CoA ligase n=1 Tax=Nocardia asteroides NBRC 15531 TaxID=1110697 RepID=U5E6U1_NOCAS|nr:AMP-binding protein [Nocardia asteroides]TLF65355.1 propionyl-CoA synthetase [Nocardia asteroides NBRC 15531]UGT47896.1 AMP-binding protein [Nocardia asteroides]SFM58771.1 propionyl-CoA synthetase [Nocardia asteroides]VEG33172.1 Acetyl-coenzyme A synthetase [Nocardia asteroides]GAD82955.1 propionate--CoA ligase [Nocardia asteroides NBRC 15531]